MTAILFRLQYINSPGISPLVLFMTLLSYIHQFEIGTQTWIYFDTTYKTWIVRRDVSVVNLFISCDQAALRTLLSVRLSVRLSICLSVTPFSLCSSDRIIMKFSGVITIDKSDVHARGQGQRSKVKVTEVMTPLIRFRTVTPVWIHIWWWNDAQSLMLFRRGALLYFKVIRQISRSHG